MKVVSRAQQGRPRRLAAVVAVVCAWGIAAASAAAQVHSPVPAPEPVQTVLQEPLPAPAEDVVKQSPAGDVRDTVRNASGAHGGGSAGGSSGAAGGASAQGASGGGQAAATGRGAAPTSSAGGSNRDPASGNRTGAGAGTGSRRGRTRRGARAGSSRRPTARRSRRDRSRAARAEAGERSPVGRAIGDIVEVVPAWLWVAFAVLTALALALAARAAVERRRRRRLEREREQLLGDLGLLQSALLPEVPERLGALAASVAYRPAEGPAAGGDFYDAFELPDGSVAAIVGDVSGHGRDALVRTAAVRHSLRNFLQSGLGPRAALAAGGRLLTDNAEGKFVTVVAALHDPHAGTLTYATAGHPPPILCGPAAHEPITVASSPPLGLGLPTGLRQTTISVPRGSVACLFTDGLLEARVGGELVGRERLTAMVADLGRREGAERLIARTLEEAEETPDDMAACVLRALEGPAVDGPRVEELEIGSAAVDLEAAGDLLAACGVSRQPAAEALDEAAGTVAMNGGAILVATLGDGEPRVDVVAPDELPVVAVRDR